jgi:hypothetical protein
MSQQSAGNTLAIDPVGPSGRRLRTWPSGKHRSRKGPLEAGRRTTPGRETGRRQFNSRRPPRRRPPGIRTGRGAGPDHACVRRTLPGMIGVAPFGCPLYGLIHLAGIRAERMDRQIGPGSKRGQVPLPGRPAGWFTRRCPSTLFFMPRVQKGVRYSCRNGPQGASHNCT